MSGKAPVPFPPWPGKLSTGRKIDANGGILGLSDSGDFTDGYDSTREHHDFPPECAEPGELLTPAEKAEIARFQIERWAIWGGFRAIIARIEGDE
jgi:hypothetical protein